LKFKECYDCKESKSLSEYNKNGPWFNNRCKPCAVKYSKKYADARKKAMKGNKWF
tara:strand:- start:142 stop:306 length:165 start_codon:yes stop_codon:yes gene_type:complete